MTDELIGDFPLILHVALATDAGLRKHVRNNFYPWNRLNHYWPDGPYSYERLLGAGWPFWYVTEEAFDTTYNMDWYDVKADLVRLAKYYDAEEKKNETGK